MSPSVPPKAVHHTKTWLRDLRDHLQLLLQPMTVDLFREKSFDAAPSSQPSWGISGPWEKTHQPPWRRKKLGETEVLVKDCRVPCSLVCTVTRWIVHWLCVYHPIVRVRWSWRISRFSEVPPNACNSQEGIIVDFVNKQKTIYKNWILKPLHTCGMIPFINSLHVLTWDRSESLCSFSHGRHRARFRMRRL